VQETFSFECLAILFLVVKIMICVYHFCLLEPKFLKVLVLTKAANFFLKSVSCKMDLQEVCVLEFVWDLIDSKK